ncbi:MAG: porin family protein [Richelia sp. RM2_1_2]|nr:porin family protein [Richelia sp. SM2_1_7]NJM19720.1 porin family protein [Richelia sp. SM1_7_0]NJN07621.1 porin family protein [Richelia sp. RM1_1_1]NJO30265.1 porin family protein [Richelia sp. SL_2_1]NJO56910.1 porin family protein [Richelia sp. RM2_1_2]
MKRFIKSCVTISALSSLLIAPVVLSAGQASAQPKKGFDGNYVGGGLSGQVTNGGQQNDAANLGGNIQGRVKIKNTPISARTKVLWNNDATAINPEISADLGINKSTNLYGAVGYSFIEQDGQSSPLGNKDSVTASIGVESQVKKGIVVYSNATVSLDGFDNSKTLPVNVGGGVGFKF